MAPNSFPSFSRPIITRDDLIDDLVDHHDPTLARRAGLGVGQGFLGHQVVGEVFDGEDQAGLAGDGRAIGQPARAAAHRLDQEVHPARLGVGQQIADLAGQGLDGREIAEGEVDAPVIVIDRLGHVNHGDSRLFRGQVILEPLELVGGLERVVAADRDQGIHAQRGERPMDRAKLGRALGIGQVSGLRDVLAGVRPRRPDQDAARVPRPPQVALVQHDVVAPFLHRIVVTVINQVGVAMHDADDLDAVAAKRGRGRRDHRIGRRSGPAGKQNGHALDRPRRRHRI